MKLKLPLFLLTCILCGRTFAQIPNNVYEDAKALKGMCTGAKLDSTRSADWLPILKKYITASNQADYASVVKDFDGNPSASTRQI